MSQSTLLGAGSVALLGGASLLTVASSYPAFDRTPTPGYVLGTETALISSRQAFPAAGLSSAGQLTLFLVASKTPSAEDLYMLAAILTAGDSTRTWVGYTGRNYRINAGLTYNTYVDGFLGATDTTLLDTGKVKLIRAEMMRNGVAFYVSGVLQTTISYNNAQVVRPWSDTLYLGGEPDNAGYTWQGTIYAAYGYLGALSSADCQRTEAYLLSKYPQIS